MCFSATATSYSQSAKYLLESYYTGRSKPVKTFSIGVFYDEWQAFIKQMLSPTDKLVFFQLNKIRIQALDAARAEDLLTAEKCIKNLRLRLLTNRLSAQGGLICQSLTKATESYIDYKYGNFAEARKKTYEALATYQSIEEEYKYEIIFFRRLQLVCNLVRIEGKSKNYQRGIELACHLLNYLQGISDVIPIPGSWGQKHITHQSSTIISATYALLVREIAELLVSELQYENELFAIVATELKLPNNNGYYLHPIAYTWLIVKQAKINKDIPEFLKLAANSIKKGRADVPLLWYATVIDLVSVCDELKLPEFQLLKQEIIKDSVNWQDCSPKFLDVLKV